MGEMADWIIEHFVDVPEDTIEEYYEDYRIKVRRVLRCKSCKSSNVYWWETRKGWRLYTDGKPHVCFRVTGEKNATKDHSTRRNDAKHAPVVQLQAKPTVPRKPKRTNKASLP